MSDISNFEKDQKAKELHFCAIKMEMYMENDEDMLAGTAMDYCFEREEDLTLWIQNSEYGNQINFCPLCGYEAKNKIKG